MREDRLASRSPRNPRTAISSIPVPDLQCTGRGGGGPALSAARRTSQDEQWWCCCCCWWQLAMGKMGSSSANKRQQTNGDLVALILLFVLPLKSSKSLLEPLWREEDGSSVIKAIAPGLTRRQCTLTGAPKWNTSITHSFKTRGWGGSYCPSGLKWSKGPWIRPLATGHCPSALA